MFYKELKNIYNKLPKLNNEFEFEEYYILLRSFFSQEIRLNAQYMSPYRFSSMNAISLDKTVRLFIALSNNDYGIFKLYYKYICECDETNIYDSSTEFSSYICRKCGEELNAELIQEADEIKLLFKITPELFKEFHDGLKILPSFDEPINPTPKEGFITLREVGALLNEDRTYFNTEETHSIGEEIDQFKSGMNKYTKALMEGR